AELGQRLKKLHKPPQTEQALPALGDGDARKLWADALPDELRHVLEYGSADARRGQQDQEHGKGLADLDDNDSVEQDDVRTSIYRPVLGLFQEHRQEHTQAYDRIPGVEDNEDKDGDKGGKERDFARMRQLALLDSVADLLFGRFLGFGFLVGPFGHGPRSRSEKSGRVGAGRRRQLECAFLRKAKNRGSHFPAGIGNVGHRHIVVALRQFGFDHAARARAYG